MPRKKATSNIDFMMSFIKKFIDGTIERMDFDLDFNYHLMQRYAGMCKENEYIAEAFVGLISNVFDASDQMNTNEMRMRLKENYIELLDIIDGGIF